MCQHRPGILFSICKLLPHMKLEIEKLTLLHSPDTHPPFSFGTFGMLLASVLNPSMTASCWIPFPKLSGSYFSPINTSFALRTV